MVQDLWQVSICFAFTAGILPGLHPLSLKGAEKQPATGQVRRTKRPGRWEASSFRSPGETREKPQQGWVIEKRGKEAEGEGEGRGGGERQEGAEDKLLSPEAERQLPPKQERWGLPSRDHILPQLRFADRM